MPRSDWPVVVVHGPPGSGKSTLTRQLAESMGLPHFDRDEIKDTIFTTLGHSDREWSTRVGDASWQLAWLLVERLLVNHVPFIVESNFRPADWIVPKMREAAQACGMRILSVHVTAEPAQLWERFDRRRREGGRHPGHAGFDQRQEFIEDLRTRPHGHIDFGCGELTVDTTHSWPDLAGVERWLAEHGTSHSR